MAPPGQPPRVAAENSGYGDPAGKIRLRRAIAGWVARSRSVLASEDTVVVTCGTQHAIDLVARVLLEPGDCVAVEDPGYVPAASACSSALGASVAGVPVDDQGLVVDLLPPSARIVYVTPSHQYPLGMTMSMPRRRALLRWAERHDAAVIEDDYDTEFRYVDRPLEPLQALDANGRVVYVGSFSKTFSPSVRLGFAVGAPAAGRADRRAAGSSSTGIRLSRCRPLWPASSTMACSTSTSGAAGASTPSASTSSPRRSPDRWPATSPPAPPNAGLHVAAVLREGLGEKEVLQAAARHGLVTSGLHDCFHTSPSASRAS